MKKVLVGLAAAALIFLDTITAVSAMVGEAVWVQVVAACIPVAATALVIAKRPVALLLLLSLFFDAESVTWTFSYCSVVAL